MNNLPGILAASLALLLFISSSAAEEISEGDCAACHAAISGEWRSSLHAAAYSSPAFQQKLKESAAAGNSSCGCHTPAALPPGYLGREPAARAEAPERGVDCLACHMDSSLTAWSSGEERYVPHWTRQEKIYSSAAFCGGCHVWGRDSGYDCQTCHMPRVEGGPDDGPRIGRTAGAMHASHRWVGSRDPELLSGAAELEALRHGDSLQVTVSSLLSAHYFPQTRHRLLKVAALAGGGPIWESDLRLAPDSTAKFSVALPENLPGLRVELRFYPVPEVQTDSFYVIRRQAIE